MKLEALMIKAIREFKKTHAKSEIRTCSIAAGTGSFNNWKEAWFCVEYVDEACGEYKEAYVHVSE